MAKSSSRPAPRAERIAESLDAVRLVVLLFLVLDVGSTLTATIFGWTGHGPTGLVPVLHGLLVALAAAAVMWHRWWWALGPLVLVTGLTLLHSPSGLEFWLVLITGVAIAVRWRGRRVAVGLLVHAAYATSFGLAVESREPGWGWAAGLTTLGFSLVGFAVGFATRRALRSRDQWRERVRRIETENAEIRAIERVRLADDLQVAMTQGLAAIDEIVATTRSGVDADALRRGLASVDARCRALLAELRILLEVLRDGTSSPAGRAETTGRSRTPAMDRSVQLAVLVVLGVLAVRTLLEVGGTTATGAGGVVIEILGLVAAAVAVFRLVPGMIIAAAALVVAALVATPGHWDLLSAGVLSLAAALRLGLRGLGVALGALAVYGGLVVLVGDQDPMVRLLPIGYVAVLAVLTGLVIRHLRHVHGDSGRRVQDLLTARQGLEAAERLALARELHDVVAHQLSNATLLILADSTSDDLGQLRRTLERVGHEATAARQELDVLLEAMRASVERPDAGPDLAPAPTAQILAAGLIDHGYRPEMEIDPGSAALDSTTTRTLARIMREAATNILRHAPSGSRCRFTLSVGEGEVRLQVESARSGAGLGAHELSLGWGLRGIRERVQLVDGSFTAGPSGDQWVLTVVLPIIAATTPGAEASRWPRRPSTPGARPISSANASRVPSV